MFARTTARRPQSFKPAVDALDSRLLPTVSYYGGGVLPHVEVQNLYLGSDWSTSAYYSQTGRLEGFSRYLVNSTYMDMLTGMGYGVGSGSASTGVIDNLAINKGYY